MLETLTPVIHVGLVKSVDASLIEAFERLVPQLSSTSKLPEREDLEAIVLSDSTHLLVATDETGRIVGTLTLALFPIPTGIRAWIEDVIVDAGARGRGVGDILNREALSLARREGAKTVDLTSRPTREAANRLYQRLGFKKTRNKYLPLFSRE